MKESTIIRVYNGKNARTYDYRKDFARNDFKFIKKAYGKGYWEREFLKDNEEITKLDKHFKSLGFKVFLLSQNDLRSTDYRKRFFQFNKGFEGYYFCAYCGLLFCKENITVDHILPIEKTYKSKFLKWLCKVLKIENINDLKNLAPACKFCNSKKGSKAGIWIIRGLIGRTKYFWIIFYIFFVVIFIVVFFKILFIVL